MYVAGALFSEIIHLYGIAGLFANEPLFALLGIKPYQRLSLLRFGKLALPPGRSLFAALSVPLEFAPLLVRVIVNVAAGIVKAISG